MSIVSASCLSLRRGVLCFSCESIKRLATRGVVLQRSYGDRHVVLVRPYHISSCWLDRSWWGRRECSSCSFRIKRKCTWFRFQYAHVNLLQIVVVVVVSAQFRRLYLRLLTFRLSGDRSHQQSRILRINCGWLRFAIAQCLWILFYKVIVHSGLVFWEYFPLQRVAPRHRGAQTHRQVVRHTFTILHIPRTDTHNHSTGQVARPLRWVAQVFQTERDTIATAALQLILNWSAFVSSVRFFL